jgi:hypothetical protein
MPKTRRWKLLGYDTFSNEWYTYRDDKFKPLEFKSFNAAKEAARKKLTELEKSQPSTSSGGQGFFGIQDRVFIETPEGEQIRVTG